VQDGLIPYGNGDLIPVHVWTGIEGYAFAPVRLPAGAYPTSVDCSVLQTVTGTPGNLTSSVVPHFALLEMTNNGANAANCTGTINYNSPTDVTAPSTCTTPVSATAGSIRYDLGVGISSPSGIIPALEGCTVNYSF
jgi:hypothetical protein